MKYIQMVLKNMIEQVIQKIIYNKEVLIHTLTLFQIDMFLGCCCNFRKITPHEEEIKNPSPKKTIGYHIYEYTQKWSNNGICPIKDSKTFSEYKKLNSDYEIG